MKKSNITTIGLYGRGVKKLSFAYTNTRRNPLRYFLYQGAMVTAPRGMQNLVKNFGISNLGVDVRTYIHTYLSTYIYFVFYIYR